LVTGSIAGVAAQDGTPATDQTGTMLCTVDPASIDELLPLWFGESGTPPAMPTEQESVQSEAELPQGSPADEETAAALTTTFHEFIACFDAGQYARAFALATDNAIGAFGPDQSNPDEDTPEEVRAFLEAQLAGTPVSDDGGTPSDQPTVVSEARDARLLEDGRAGAVFESEGDVLFVIFAQEDDTWLVDALINVAEQGTPEAGT
jgi:hypothetical protein